MQLWPPENIMTENLQEQFGLNLQSLFSVAVDKEQLMRLIANVDMALEEDYFSRFSFQESVYHIVATLAVNRHGQSSVWMKRSLLHLNQLLHD